MIYHSHLKMSKFQLFSTEYVKKVCFNYIELFIRGCIDRMAKWLIIVMSSECIKW